MKNRSLTARHEQIENPFSAEQLQRIASKVPAHEQESALCLQRIVASTRRFLITQHTQEKLKVQARDELSALLATTERLRSQLSQLGVGARMALAENFANRGGNEFDFTYDEYVGDFILELDCFHDFQLGAIDLAAKKASGGRRDNAALRQLYSSIKSAYLAACGKPRGFWEFFRAVCEPLSRAGLEPRLAGGDFDTWVKTWEDTVRVRGEPQKSAKTTPR